jgi:hypothetical protein
VPRKQARRTACLVGASNGLDRSSPIISAAIGSLSGKRWNPVSGDAECCMMSLPVY